LSERARDAAWFQAVARSRGVTLSAERAGELAAAATAILAAFDELVGGLAVDDGIDDFRRLLDAERPRV
jgi:hypothetical protein